RADWERSGAVDAALEKSLIDRLLAALPRVRAVVLSDYAKGVLTPALVGAAIGAARRQGIPVIVDPKGVDYSIYRGATLLTPNRKELSEAPHRPGGSRAELEAAAAALIDAIECEAVLVTLSEDGMMLLERGGAPAYVPAYPVRVRDVSGAGDTVAAAL